jgi:hypothetical protein
VFGWPALRDPDEKLSVNLWARTAFNRGEVSRCGLGSRIRISESGGNYDPGRVAGRR